MATCRAHLVGIGGLLLRLSSRMQHIEPQLALDVLLLSAMALKLRITEQSVTVGTAYDIRHAHQPAQWEETHMSVKLSVSLTDQQHAFARSLVTSGRYPTLSAALQHGFDLLRQKIDSESAETDVLREILHHRLSGSMVAAVEMEGRVNAMIERKRRSF
jgi:antitoxin ParD1/3/4